MSKEAMVEVDEPSPFPEVSNSSQCGHDPVSETSNKMEGVETEAEEEKSSVTSDEELLHNRGSTIPGIEIGPPQAAKLQQGVNSEDCAKGAKIGEQLNRESEKLSSQDIKADTSDAVGVSLIDTIAQDYTLMNSSAHRTSTSTGELCDHVEKEAKLDEVYIHDKVHPLISDDIRRYKGLRVLKVFANEMRILPEGVEGLADLEHLHFKSDTLNVGALPSLKNLRNLKALELYQVPPRMSSCNLPDDVAELVNLQRLAVCHYSITSLPSNLGLLTGLEELDLSFNRLVTLSPSIGSLASLRVLKLASNRLKELCQELSQLVKLNVLDLSHNRLTSLQPLRLAMLTSLRSLNLEHNKLLGAEEVPEWMECRSDCHVGTPGYEGDHEEQDSDDGDASESSQSNCTGQSRGKDVVWSPDGPIKPPGVKLVSDSRPQKQLRGAGSVFLVNGKDCQQRKARQEKLHERRCAGKPISEKERALWTERRGRGVAKAAACGGDEPSVSEVTVEDGMEGEFAESVLDKESASLDPEKELEPEEGTAPSASVQLLAGAVDSTEMLPGEDKTADTQVRLLSGYNKLASVACIVQMNGGVDNDGEVCSGCERMKGQNFGGFSEDDDTEEGQNLAADNGPGILEEGSGTEEAGSGSGGAGFGLRRGRKDGPRSDRNPKPSKRRRQMRGSSGVSRKYHMESICGFGDRLHDGFYDAGRERPFLPLHVLEQEPPVMNQREVILVDRARDEELDVLVHHARALLSNDAKSRSRDTGGDSQDGGAAACSCCHRWTGESALSASELRTRVEKLALFVSDAFGGSERNSVMLSARRTALGQRVGREVVTAGRGPPAFGWGRPAVFLPRGLRTEVSCFLPKMDELCERAVNTVKSIVNSNVVPIGSIPFGICRHRAILFKYLCDRANPIIPCELVRGYMDGFPHAWNVVGIRGSADEDEVERLLVDVCRPFDMGPEDHPEYMIRYLPLQRLRLPWLSGKSSAGTSDSLKLVLHEEIGQGASGAVVRRCSFGPHVAAAKILRLPAFATSATSRLSSLPPGFPPIELRVLCHLPPHPCIVPYYGHRLAMFQPPATTTLAPGVSPAAGSVAHELILFSEVIKGGCLEEFIKKKCREGGLKHVPVDSAFLVAHGVARAIAWVHAHGFLHRDIKSSNVLVDTVKLPDATLDAPHGGPVAITSVKLCDFSHAVALEEPAAATVPLDASGPVGTGPGQAACCMGGVGRPFAVAASGSPGPDVCVGTAQWMAPEVLRAMYSRQPYSKPADIWSFGCLLCELLSLDRPYAGLSEGDTDAHIRMGRRPPLPPSLQHLLPESVAGSLLEAWTRHTATLAALATAGRSTPSLEDPHRPPVAAQLAKPRGEESAKRLELLVFLMAACTVPDPRERPCADELASFMALHAPAPAPAVPKKKAAGELGTDRASPAEVGRSNKDCVVGEKLGEREVESASQGEEGVAVQDEEVSCRGEVTELCQEEGDAEADDDDGVVEAEESVAELQIDAGTKVGAEKKGEREGSSLVEHGGESVEPGEDVLIAL